MADAATDAFLSAVGHVAFADDCDRDPDNPTCDPEGAATACEREDPLEACRCTYGAEVQRAVRTGLESPSQCPVYRCEYAPCAPGGRLPPLCETPPVAVVVAAGDDWSLPAGVEPANGAAFYGFGLSEEHGITVRAVDQSWRQLNPAPGVYATDQPDRIAPGGGDGFVELRSLDARLEPAGDVWLRVFTSGVGWAPEWVVRDCEVEPVDGHLPIWNPCVWGHLLALYRHLLVDLGLGANPRVHLVYVPGAFRYAEYGFGVVRAAFLAGRLDEVTYVAWFRQATADLAALLEPADRGKLVFTGEDFPWDVPPAWDPLVIGTLPAGAVELGLGIRNGIPENHDSHLNHVPAYGHVVDRLGYVREVAGWPTLDAERVVGMENECFTSCGIPFPPDDPYEHIRLTNLKALQLRATHIFVVPEDSHMDAHAEHWRWVRLELGRTPSTAPDAWSAPRETRDRFWRWGRGHDWLTRPWVRNVERWLRHRDVCGDGVGRRGSRRTGDLFYADAIAYEGRRTDIEVRMMRVVRAAP